MEFAFTEEQDELRRSIRHVLDRECPPSFARAVVEDRGDAGPLWRRMVELGWPALTIGEADGGLGLGYVELAILAEELGRAVAPGPLLATLSQFAPVVRETGSGDQHRRLLAGVAAGELTGSLAVAEDRSGPGTSAWTTHAFHTRAVQDGDGWRVHGTKHWVAEAPDVDELVVAAATHDGETVLLAVPRDDVHCEAVDSLDASRSHATVHLDEVEVPRDRVLASGPEARDALRRGLHEATVAAAAETVGVSARLFELTLDYVKVRQQFGVPIGSFQAVKHKLADAFIALEKARATMYFAALTIAEDDPRRELAVAMAKSAAGDCQERVVRESIQLHGGIAYTWEHDVHILAKRAMSGGMLFGTAREHRARVAELVGLGPVEP
jgi:alkylation response protein AidB-like acyl-CoA dehydrogenase